MIYLLLYVRFFEGENYNTMPSPALADVRKSQTDSYRLKTTPFLLLPRADAQQYAEVVVITKTY